MLIYGFSFSFSFFGSLLSSSKSHNPDLLVHEYDNLAAVSAAFPTGVVEIDQVWHAPPLQMEGPLFDVVPHRIIRVTLAYALNC